MGLRRPASAPRREARIGWHLLAQARRDIRPRRETAWLQAQAREADFERWRARLKQGQKAGCAMRLRPRRDGGPASANDADLETRQHAACGQLPDQGGLRTMS